MDLIQAIWSAGFSDALFFEVQAIDSYNFFSQNVKLHTYSVQ